MKRVITYILTVVFVLLCAIPASAADTVTVGTSEKVVFKDSDWAYEKVRVYGYEIDEYIGSNENASVPYSYAKEFVNSIGSYAFSGKNVKKVDTTYKIESIGEYAFNGCSSLESVTLFSSVGSIGMACFYGDSSLININLEDTSVNSISSYCFAECGFSSLELPETCCSIGEYAFYNCTNLTHIFIPATVTEIADTAFKGSDNAVIECYNNSYAMQYAIDHGIDYDVIDPLKGDFDGDGVVTVNDATYIQMNDVGMSLPFTVDKHALKRGEVTGDGEVDVRDATMVQMKLANMISSFD